MGKIGGGLVLGGEKRILFGTRAPNATHTQCRPTVLMLPKMTVGVVGPSFLKALRVSQNPFLAGLWKAGRAGGFQDSQKTEILILFASVLLLLAFGIFLPKPSPRAVMVPRPLLSTESTIMAAIDAFISTLIPVGC